MKSCKHSYLTGLIMVVKNEIHTYSDPPLSTLTYLTNGQPIPPKYPRLYKLLGLNRPSGLPWPSYSSNVWHCFITLKIASRVIKLAYSKIQSEQNVHESLLYWWEKNRCLYLTIFLQNRNILACWCHDSWITNFTFS